MIIRPATPADIPTLRTLAHSIWNAVYPSIIAQEQIEFMLDAMYNPAQINAEMASGYAWELVEENSQPIGFLATVIETSGALKVSKIYLETAYHGKGYGQEILKHIDAHAKASGASSVYLFVNRNNARAIRSYRRAGYEIVETLDQTFGRFMLNDYKMAKSI